MVGQVNGGGRLKPNHCLVADVGGFTSISVAGMPLRHVNRWACLLSSGSRVRILPGTPKQLRFSLDSPLLGGVHRQEVAGPGGFFFGSRSIRSVACSSTAPDAQRLAKWLEFHHTPMHGSWLNMAEAESSVLARACLRGRNGDGESLGNAANACVSERNPAGATINWRFTTRQARTRMRRQYHDTPALTQHQGEQAVPLPAPQVQRGNQLVHGYVTVGQQNMLLPIEPTIEDLFRHEPAHRNASARPFIGLAQV